MADGDLSMYDVEEDDLPPRKADGTVQITKTPMTTEMVIAGEKISIINPQYVMDLQRHVMNMAAKMRHMDDQIRQLSNTQRKTIGEISDVRRRFDERGY